VRWLLLALVAVTAVVAVNVALLSHSGAPNDPVGKLVPVASIPTPPAATVTRGHEDDD
jgi:hypothetical protein